MAASGEAYRKSLGVSISFTRANRWVKQGVLDQVFSALQESDVINIQVDYVSVDSTAVKVHPDGTGALRKTVHNLSVNQ